MSDDIDLWEEIMDNAVKATRQQKRADEDAYKKWRGIDDETTADLGYDPGKHNTHFEKVEDDVWGVYTQTYDSPEGDVWEAWLVAHKGDGLKVFGHKTGERFYGKRFFKEWLDEMPYGKVK